MKNKVIAISREFGSGGRTVGKLTAEKLGIPCYDQEIIQKIAEESGLCEDFIAEHGEYASHGNWFANAFANRDYYRMIFGPFSVKSLLNLQKKAPVL